MNEQKRGRNVALMGAMLQTAFAVVMVIIAVWTKSPSAWACAWLLGGGLALWLMTALLMYCRQLAEREAAELEQLSQEQGDPSTIFTDEQASAHRTAQKRVDVMLRWVAPAFTVLWAAFNGAVGYWMFARIGSLEASLATQTGQAALFGVLIGFVAFLFSFYALGMSRQLVWRPLRAPANYLLICVLAIAGVLIGLIASQQEYGGMDRVMAHLIPILQLLLAAELFLTFVMDIYRPRVPGTEQRLVYDSRVFGLVGQWRRLGQAMAEAVNYQFGFEVSTTWFFRLLGRAATPLVLIGAAALLLMSSIVLVDQGEVAVVSHWGRVDASQEPLGPGIHLKWPWPIDTARHFDLRVRSMPIGAGEAREQRTDIVEGGVFHGRELALWTVEHGEREENDFLVAVAPEDQGEQRRAGDVPPVNIIRLVGSLHYRIADPYRFGYVYTNAEEVLADIAHREMVQFCSSATLFTSGPDAASGRPEAIMTYGRERMGRQLEQRIRQAVQSPEVDLGVEIVSLNLRTVHPPTAAADAFEEVLRARLGQEVQRFSAQAEANRLYFSVAEYVGDAQKLAIWIDRARTLAFLEDQHRQGRDLAPHIEQVLQRVNNHLQSLDKDIEREMLLGKLDGDEESVTVKVHRLLAEYRQQLEQLRDAAAAGEPLELVAKASEALKQADELFKKTCGEPAQASAEAEREYWDMVLQERGRSALFPAQFRAYQASPDLYALDRYLDVWDKVLPGVQKYVIGLDPNRLEPWLNLEQGGSVYEQIQFSQGAPSE